LKSHAEGLSDHQEDGQLVRSTTGRQLDILPGMTSQLDIRTGDRTLMDFYLNLCVKHSVNHSRSDDTAGDRCNPIFLSAPERDNTL
jgi:hypothetical protein